MKTKIGMSIVLVLLLLLAFGGTASALPGWSYPDITSCSPCHELPDYSLKNTGDVFKSTHSNDSTITVSTSECGNCHIDAKSGDYAMLSGTPEYLTSEECQNCHKSKYDSWYNGTHRLKLIPAEKAEAAGYPLVNASSGSNLDYTWDDISYVIGGKYKVRYINSTGYIITKNKNGSINGSNQYNVRNKTWDNYHAGEDKQYNCGNCHTTGYDINGSFPGMPGIVGNWTEPGVGCEACHGGAGNGHQVSSDNTAQVCGNCHIRAGTSSGGTVYTKEDVNPDRKHHEQYNDFVNGPHNNTPAESPYGRDSCQNCHSPFEYVAKQIDNVSVSIEDAGGISCSVCHDPHDVSDDRYAAYDAPNAYNASLFSDLLNHTKLNTLGSGGVAPLKMVKAFNTTASTETGVLTWDDLEAPANRTVTETLCLNCHARHGKYNIYGDEEVVSGSGFIHRTESGNSHGELKYPGYGRRPAACVDCHMPYSSKTSNEWDIRSHTFDVIDGIEFDKGPLENFPELTCGRSGQCHSGTHSLVPIFDEWDASAHNVKEVGVGGSDNHYYGTFNETTGEAKSRQATCDECHSPMQWDPTNTDSVNKTPLTEDFPGVSCAVCHNIHDMGNWLKDNGVAYGAYNATKYAGERHGSAYYYAGYDAVESTTELCGNCHMSKRVGRSKPGWSSDTATKPNRTHGFPAKDLFVGSWKQEGMLDFECIDCHMATSENASIMGHSFKVNATLLQENSECSVCHVTGSELGNISTTIEDIQTRLHAKYNTTNTIVTDALAAVNAYDGEKSLSRDKIALAYWNKQLVGSDESWGAHNPSKIDELLDDAVRLANEANASLGVASESVSSVALKKGLNLVALKGTPTATSAASVMSSVKDNISVVWGYSTGTWELYDPVMDAAANTLENIVPGKGYWIYAKEDCEWTA